MKPNYPALVSVILVAGMILSGDLAQGAMFVVGIIVGVLLLALHTGSDDLEKCEACSAWENPDHGKR